MQYYLYDPDQKKPAGPFEAEVLKFAAGFGPDSRVCPLGQKNWVPAKSVPELAGLLAALAAAPPSAAVPAADLAARQAGLALSPKTASATPELAPEVERAPARVTDASAPRALGALMSDALKLSLSALGVFSSLAVGGAVARQLLAQIGAAMSGLPLGSHAAISQAFKSAQYERLSVYGALLSLGNLASFFASSALVLALAAKAQGRTCGVWDSLRRMLRAFLPLLWVEILTVGSILLGLIAFVVPGVVLMIRYLLARYAVLLDDRRGGQALGRSKEIMIAHMGKVVGNFLVMALAAVALVFSGRFVLAVIVESLLGAIPAPPPSWLVTPLSFLIVLPEALTRIWTMAFMVLLYRDLAALHPLKD